MKNLSKILIICFCVLTAGQLYAQKTEKELMNKTFSPQSESTLVKVNNSFGNISLNTWDKNEIQITVTLLLVGYDQKESEKLQDQVQINSKESASEINVYTDLAQKNVKMKGTKKFEINYQISLPSKQALFLTNSFGNIFMQDQSGGTQIDIEYGNLTAGNINSLQLHQEFGKSEIESIKSGNLSFSYSDRIEIGKAGDLEIESEFSKVDIGNLNSLKIEAEYGAIKLAEVNKLEVEMEFTGLTVDNIVNSFQCEAEYASGAIKILALGSALDTFTLHTEFSKSEIFLNPSQSFGFKSDHSFGDLEIKGGKIKFGKSVKDDFDKHYEGTIGENTTPATQMDLSSTYGNIKIIVE